MEAVKVHGGSIDSISAKKMREFDSASIALKDKGIELAFRSRESYLKDYGAPKGEGPYVMAAVFYFPTGSSKYSAYQGKIPLTEGPVTDRDQAFAAFGEPSETEEEDGEIYGDLWTIDGRLVGVDYRDDLSVSVISVGFPKKQTSDHAGVNVQGAESAATSDDPLTPPDDPARLLGRGWDDPELQQVVGAWPDREYIDDESIEKAVENGRLSLFNFDLGMYLFLTDGESFMSRYGATQTAGALHVGRVVLFGRFHANVKPYSGAVVDGLGTQSSFQDWTDAIGQPEWVHKIDDVVRKARWHVAERVVDVSFTASGECLLISLTPALSQEALAAQSAAQQLHAQLLSPDDVLASLGKPLSSSDLVRSFQAIDYASKLGEAPGYGMMDFSDDYGFELYAATRDQLKVQTPSEAQPSDLCLSGARYRTDLDFKCAPWQGPLPFGITFDDGPDTVLAKLGRPADQQEFDEMDGFHRWQFPFYDLHVLYSLPEDRVYRVTLLGRRQEGSA